MAPAKPCPVCGHVMWAKHEDFRPKGTYVTYICQNRECRDYIKTEGRYPYEETVFVDDEKQREERSSRRW